ncbi:glycosyltransferase [Nonomuraea sp. NPDC059194]|uniref:glycosyltransferase n=1 Tax=Nonomuraea sp. NPDC059194 TaxID=3346764 RepID=UPI003692FC08
MAPGAATRTTSALRPELTPDGTRQPVVDVVIPVLNEELALPGCVKTLHAFLSASFPLPWRITIADNGSTDRTWAIAQELSETYEDVFARRLDIRGRGAALKQTWRESPAAIVAYMDVDLSTDLDAFLPLVAPLISGHSEVAIGTRLARSARVHRSAKREIVSRVYNLMIRIGFGAGFSDAQCGFKAVRADLVRPILDKISDDRWFFDTELLLLAEFNGLRIHETPVDWYEDVDTRVKVCRTAWDDIRGLGRMAWAMSTGAARVPVPRRSELTPLHPQATIAEPRNPLLAKLLSFAVVGVASTVLHTLLYLLLRSAWSPAVANFAALCVATLFNTEANRRWTFRRHGGPPLRAHFRAGLLFALNYLVTTVAVTAAVDALPEHGRGLEVVTLLVAYLAVTVFRFVALDRWVFRSTEPTFTA